MSVVEYADTFIREFPLPISFQLQKVIVKHLRLFIYFSMANLVFHRSTGSCLDLKIKNSILNQNRQEYLHAVRER